jgi:hypothetical protein
MTNYLSYSSPTSFRSKFNPVVGLNSKFLSTYNRDFLHPIFLQMCSDLNIQPTLFDYLPTEDLITEKEFEKINMELAKPYFYEKLFPLIKKNQKGKVENRILYTFTYDNDLTPITKGQSRYGVINLGTKPIFYYCYVELQETIRFIKSLE